MPNPQVVVDFVANTAKLQAASGEVGGAASKAGSAARTAFLPAVGVLAAVAAGAVKATDAASDLNEQISASQQVFGRHAKGVQKWAQTGADAFGLSATEALSAANAYGNMFSAVGLGAGETAKMSESMVQLAGDMASFHDQDPAEMLTKLQSGLAGEAEPLRKFGVLMSDAAIKTFAYQHGIAKAGSELTDAQKIQARYGFIMQETSKAQGDFARTSDSVANQQRTLKANAENTAAAFGKALLPAAQALLGIFQAVMGVVGGNTKALSVLIGIVAALAAAVIAVNVAMAVYNAVTVIAGGAAKAYAAAQWLVNAALSANPIGIVVIALVALVAAFVLAYKHSETFREIVDKAFAAVLGVAKALWGWLKSNWPLLLAIIGGPIVAAAVLIAHHWDAIRSATSSAWGAVRSAVASVVDWIKGALSSLGTWISGWVHGALSTATNRAGDAFDKISDGAKAVVAAVRTAMAGVAHAIEAAVGAVRSAANSVANAIKGPINAVLNAWNGLSFTIPKVTIPKIKIGKKTFGGGGFGGQTIPFPNVPTLASGGVVADPTLAIIGDTHGDREIVAPEQLLRDIVAGSGAPQVRVFIGDTELRGIVRAEVVDANTGIARTLIARGA